MSSHHDLPPNPREAKYRRAPMHWSAYPVTVVLIAICIAVAALSKLGADKEKISKLFFVSEESWGQAWQAASEDLIVRNKWDASDVNNPAVLDKIEDEAYRRLQRGAAYADIMKGEVWRLFTPMFIHFGPIHLLFNMMWMWDLGRTLESRFRPLRFTLLVLFTCLVAELSQALFSSPYGGGMSGVVYGLFGFILIRQKFHPAGDIRLNPQTVPWMLIWLVVCFTGYLGPIGNAAHVGGLVSGGVVGWINAMMGGGWGVIQRRRNFQRSLARSDSVLHRCAVCQKTEHDDPNMDFRVGEDGEEYCTDHLPGVRRAP